MDLWQLNLRHLAAVAAIVRRGSLSTAAHDVSLTQPALTQGLAKLERQLGQLLFERRADGMTPTPGAVLLAPRIAAALLHIGSSRVTMAHIRALIAVADGGSYATAGEATGLSLPTLHRAVGDVAIALRRPVVERRGRGIALTESGRRTVRSFRLARAELTAGLAELAALLGHEIGRITVGAMPLSRARLLPAAIVAFHRDNPTTEIRIIEGSRAELIEPLRDGDIDFLVGALRTDQLDRDIVQLPLFEDRPVVFGRRGHPCADRGDFPIAALAKLPWVVSAPGTPLRLLWERMFSTAGLPAPAVRVECGSVLTIRQVLLASDFLTVLSRDQVAVELEAGWLVQIGDVPIEQRTIGITTRADWRPTVAQQRFLDVIDTVKATIRQSL